MKAYQVEFSPRFHFVGITATEIFLAVDLPEVVGVFKKILSEQQKTARSEMTRFESKSSN